MKKRLKAALATAGLVAAAGVVGASPASADTCPATRDYNITGARSHYTIWCSGSSSGQNFINIDGWVKDTKKDGKCAVVEIRYDGSDSYYIRACGYGKTTNFLGHEPIARENNDYNIRVWTYVD